MTGVQTCALPISSEYLTSQKCSTCESQTMDMRKLNEEERSKMMEKVPESLLRKLTSDSDLERGLRFCSNRMCNSRFVHRDENASKNILKAMWYKMTKGVRPEYLSRTCTKVTKMTKVERALSISACNFDESSTTSELTA